MEVQTLVVSGGLNELSEGTISLCVQSLKDNNIIAQDHLSEENGEIIAITDIETDGKDQASTLNNESGVASATVVEELPSVEGGDSKQDQQVVNFDGSIPLSCVQEIDHSENGIVPFIVEDSIEGTIENGFSGAQVLHCLDGRTIMLTSGGMQTLNGQTIALTKDANGQDTFTVVSQGSVHLDPNQQIQIESSDNASAEELPENQTLVVPPEGTALTDSAVTYTITGVMENSDNAPTEDFNSEASASKMVNRPVRFGAVSDPATLDSEPANDEIEPVELDDGEQSAQPVVPAKRTVPSDSRIRKMVSDEPSLEKEESSSPPPPDSNPNTVEIDISNPIHLCQNSLIVVNGQKCVLQQNHQTGQLLAYPIKEPEKPKKKRGRPRKVRPDPSNNHADDESQDGMLGKDVDADLSEEDLEKGLIEKPNEAGEIVKRSARKRKKNFILNDYEMGGLNLDGLSEDDGDAAEEEDDEELSSKKRNKTKGKLKKVANPAPVIGNLQAGKRQRGRPRRYGLKQPQPETQAFLVQLSDGQTVMMQVPVGNLPPGITVQSIAQSIAESLQNSPQARDTPITIAPRPLAEAVSAGAGGSITSSVTIAINDSNTQEDDEDDDDAEKGLSVSMENEQRTIIECTVSKDMIEPSPESLNAPVIAISEKNSDENLEEATTPEKASNEDKDESGANNQMDANNPTVIPVPQKLVPIILSKPETPIKIGLKASENDLEKLRCPKCDFQAYYQQQYQDHLALHPDDVHRCKCCSHLALEEDDLFLHYKENHPKCICEVCNHTAEHAYIIKRHMYRHSDTGCACMLCGKTYKDHYILKMHMKMVHLPAEVLFECEVCNKKFTRKAHLKRHLRTHAPDKPYKCSVCEYRGCEKSDITKHMLIHEEPKHSCEVCGKSFRHIKNKELHVKRHKGQRDYKCGVCDFYGYTFTDIRKHIERKHADAKITCERCGQAFKSEASIKEHQTSGQCELFMLDQTNVEATNKIEATSSQAELQESSNVTTIALPDGSLATLSDFASSGQIILTGDNQLSHSQLIDQNGQLAIVTDPEGITQVAMVNDQGEINTEFALVTDEGDNVAMVTQDGAMLEETMENLDDESNFSSKEQSQVPDS